MRCSKVYSVSHAVSLSAPHARAVHASSTRRALISYRHIHRQRACPHRSCKKHKEGPKAARRGSPDRPAGSGARGASPRAGQKRKAPGALAPQPGVGADSSRCDSPRGSDSPGAAASAVGARTPPQKRRSVPCWRGPEPFQGLADLPEPDQGEARAARRALPRAGTWQECAAVLLPQTPPPCYQQHCPGALACAGRGGFALAAGSLEHAAGGSMAFEGLAAHAGMGHGGSMPSSPDGSGVVASLAAYVGAADGGLAPPPRSLEHADGGSGASMAGHAHAGHGGPVLSAGSLGGTAGGSNASADLASVWEYCEGLGDPDFAELEMRVGLGDPDLLELEMRVGMHPVFVPGSQPCFAGASKQLRRESVPVTNAHAVCELPRKLHNVAASE